jgi:hypothetical protein
MKLEFLKRLSKNPQISNFMKIRPLEAELLHTDGRKERHDEAELFFASLRKRLRAHWVTNPKHQSSFWGAKNSCSSQLLTCCTDRWLSKLRRLTLSQRCSWDSVHLGHITASSGISSRTYRPTKVRALGSLETSRSHYPQTKFHIHKNKIHSVTFLQKLWSPAWTIRVQTTTFHLISLNYSGKYMQHLV